MASRVESRLSRLNSAATSHGPERTMVDEVMMRITSKDDND